MTRRRIARAGLAGLLALGLCGGPASATTVPATALDEIHDYLARLEAFGFAGVVAISLEGDPILVEGYGLANREQDIPWTPATVSTVGSLTKQFTGATLLSLQEQKLLSVDDPISQYFDNVPEDQRAITLHHLLTHTSGIVDLDDVDDFVAMLAPHYAGEIVIGLAIRPPEDRHAAAFLKLSRYEGEDLAQANLAAIVRAERRRRTRLEPLFRG